MILFLLIRKFLNRNNIEGGITTDNQLKVFKNDIFEVAVKLQNGEWVFDAEKVAKSLGLVGVSTKSGGKYEWVRWDRVNEYLKASPQVGKGDFIPEPAVYKLAFKASNEVAEKFQDWLAVDVLPQIRQTGGYIANDDLFIKTYLPFADDQTKLLFKNTLQVVKKQNETIQLMKPKSDYFDALVERNLLANFRDTAKELKVSEKKFIEWLENKYIYRDTKGKIRPYAKYTPDLFELKEFTRQNSGYTDKQVLITPKGRETFRLLLIKDGLIKDIA